MINLLCLFCSLCIQFGAVGLTPFNMLPLNTENESYIDTVKSQITGSKSRYWSSYANYVNIPNDYWVVIKGYNNSGSAIVCLAPNEYVDSTKTTTITCDAFNTDEDSVVSSAKLKFNQYTAFPVATNSTWIDSNANIHGWKTYDFLGGDWSLLYCNIPIYYNGALIISITDDVTVPTGPQLPGIGSLSPGGHSSGGSPLESLQGFSWSAHSSTYIQSGHNTHVTPSSATPDFTNAEQNLLGQIVDNTNSLIENTNNLGGALEVINGNIINGASAIFNAISQFNDNFVTTYVYDQEQVDETLANSSMLLFVQTSNDLTQTIINESQVLLDAVHDMEEQQDLILYLDLTKWKVPVYTSSTGVNTSYIRPYNEVVEIDFTFLKETKSIWQPILLGVLYLALFMSIYFDLPNILRGANA